MKLTPSFRNVLTVLLEADSKYVLANTLPDGNGRCGGASGIKLKQMKDAGLIEYGKTPRGPRSRFAPSYYDEPYQREEGPEECADVDMSYWEE